MFSMTIPKSTSDDGNETGVRAGLETVMTIGRILSPLLSSSWLVE